MNTNESKQLQQIIEQSENNGLIVSIAALETELKKLVILSRKIMNDAVNLVNNGIEDVDTSMRQIHEAALVMTSLIVLNEHKESVNKMVDEMGVNLKGLEDIQTLLQHDLERMKQG